MSTIKFRDQHYRLLRNQLTSQGRKFEDPEFSPPGSSGWRRPLDLAKKPRLVADGVSGSDVLAGDSGCDWFVTACSVLTIRPVLIGLVVPDYQSQDYGCNFHPGIFRFAFGRQGRVYEVVVDDRLPASGGGRPKRCRSADGNEFWGALLEKAYAKLHGGYQTLRQGRIADAMASFARGIPDHWDLGLLAGQVDLGAAAVQERLARLMECHVRRDGLLLFSIRPDGKSNRAGDITPENLVCSRGYLLTDVQQVRLESGTKVWLLKLRTARYSEEVIREWLGPWRDGGTEWSQLDVESAARVNHWFKDDCIFWMCLTDAMTRFTDLDMCVARDDCGFNSHWRCSTACLEGRWAPAGGGGGGGAGDLKTANPLAGPQFRLRVRGDGFQTVTLCLEQGGPEVACRPDLQAEIGLDLYRAEDNRRCRLNRPARLVARAVPERRPAVTFGAALSPGVYVLVPVNLGAADRFTLRAFSRLGFKLKPLTRTASGSRGCRRHEAVTRLAVHNVTGLARWLGREAGEVKAKLRVSCGDSDIADWYTRYYYADKSQLDTYSTDLSLLIRRRRLGTPVRIEVFHSSVGSYTKSPVGWASIGESPAPTGHEVTLIGWDGQPMGVKLHCSLCTLDDEDEL